MMLKKTTALLFTLFAVACGTAEPIATVHVDPDAGCVDEPIQNESGERIGMTTTCPGRGTVQAFYP
jgi:hypothetical protein